MRVSISVIRAPSVAAAKRDAAASPAAPAPAMMMRAEVLSFVAASAWAGKAAPAAAPPASFRKRRRALEAVDKLFGLGGKALTWVSLRNYFVAVIASYYIREV